MAKTHKFVRSTPVAELSVDSVSDEAASLHDLTDTLELLKATQEALREAEEQITNLTGALSASTNQCHHLTQQLETSEGQIELLTGELTAYAAEYQETLKANPASAERLAELQASVFDMSAQKIEAEARAAMLQTRVDLIERCRLFQVMTSTQGEVLGQKLLVIAPDAAAAITAAKVAAEKVANVLLVSSDIRCI